MKLKIYYYLIVVQNLTDISLYVKPYNMKINKLIIHNKLFLISNVNGM